MPQPYPGLKDPPIPGAEIILGPFLFFVPPMRLADVKASVKEGLLKQIAAIRKEDGGVVTLEWDAFEEGAEAILTILERSLKRNYPTITRAEIEDLADIVNCEPAMTAILVQNGLAESPSWAGATPTPPAGTDQAATE